MSAGGDKVGNGRLRSLHSRQLRTAQVHTYHRVSINITPNTGIQWNKDLYVSAGTIYNKCKKQENGALCTQCN